MFYWMIIKLFYRPVDFHWPHSGQLKLRSEPSSIPASSFSHEEPVNWFDLITSQGDIKSLSRSISLRVHVFKKKPNRCAETFASLCCPCECARIALCSLNLFIMPAQKRHDHKNPSTTSLSDLNHFHLLLFF